MFVSRRHLFSGLHNISEVHQKTVKLRMMAETRPQKRQRLADSDSADASDLRAKRAAFLSSLSRPISPPRNSATPPAPSASQIYASASKRSVLQQDERSSGNAIAEQQEETTKAPKVFRSPVQLTSVRGLSASENVDTVSLHEILGNPLIKEAWIFNYCFDVDWLMQHFDPDVRDIVKIKIVHGSWRREDTNKIMIDEACSRMQNVQAIQAYLPDQFGTHHSKMFILFRHDDCAQVIIHTANMLERDWSNMTQAVWKSPLLPLSAQSTAQKKMTKANTIGSGGRFKHDLMRYIKAYGGKLKPLKEQLSQYDFREVRAALIASVPSKCKVSDDEVWGHLALRRAVTQVISPAQLKGSHLVCQVSSIATLPAKWLDETIFEAAGVSSQASAKANSITTTTSASQTSIIFPTRTDIALSLDGYAGGGSVHTKAQSAAHLKQIANLRPHLHRWTQALASSSATNVPAASSQRHLAEPHIKTYVSFSSKPTSQSPTPSINWALMTSANLSQQAWGTTAKLQKGEKDQGEATVHIQSYEIGVLFWPELFAKDFGSDNAINGGAETEAQEVQHQTMQMVPVFGKDTPEPRPQNDEKQSLTLIGFRMPYDLPLTPYTTDELPWSPQSTYKEPDRHGRRWPPDDTWR